MVPFPVLRRTFRIPWMRENREAIHALSDMFYLLIALHRCRRFQDLRRFQYAYFVMIHSVARHGRSEARETLEQLTSIPWFAGQKRNIYRLLASYERAHRVMERLTDGTHSSVINSQLEINLQVTQFVEAFKAITTFGSADAARLQRLVADPARIDAMLEQVFGALPSTSPSTGRPSTPSPDLYV